jgi:hypothetical protein
MVPNMALDVIDKAVQVHGAMGVCQDTPLANMWAHLRTLRIADGPDEVSLQKSPSNLSSVLSCLYLLLLLSIIVYDRTNI